MITVIYNYEEIVPKLNTCYNMCCYCENKVNPN
jgi:hypothetical protein